MSQYEGALVKVKLQNEADVKVFVDSIYTQINNFRKDFTERKLDNNISYPKFFLNMAYRTFKQVVGFEGDYVEFYTRMKKDMDEHFLFHNVLFKVFNTIMNEFHNPSFEVLTKEDMFKNILAFVNTRNKLNSFKNQLATYQSDPIFK